MIGDISIVGGKDLILTHYTLNGGKVIVVSQHAAIADLQAGRSVVDGLAILPVAPLNEGGFAKFDVRGVIDPK